MAEIIVSISTIEDREKLFTVLYKNAFPVVAKYVSRMGGSFDDAKDIFQDAVVIYYEKVIAASLSLTYSEKSYILGIAKHLWIKKYRSNNASISLENNGMEIAEDIDESPSTRKLLKFLENAGQKCMELLRIFYYDKLSRAEIAKAFGYTSIRSATVQKYKCLEKLRDTIKEKTLSYEDFLE